MDLPSADDGVLDSTASKAVGRLQAIIRAQRAGQQWRVQLQAADLAPAAPIRVNVVLDGDPASALGVMGDSVRVVWSDGRRALLEIDPSDAAEVAAAPQVRMIWLDEPARPEVTSEALSTMNGPQYHDADPAYTGQGVRVAIVDSEFEGLGTQVTGGEVPTPHGMWTCDTACSEAEALDGRFDADDVHGAGVAEIVSDLAPDAELLLYLVRDQVSAAAAIRHATEAGARVITMSLGFNPTEVPLSGAGGVGGLYEAVAAASDEGVLFLKSAGNSGRQGYSAVFTPDDDEVHELYFGGSEIFDIEFAAVEDKPFALSLTWDEWNLEDPNASAAPSDFDLLVFDSAGTRIMTDQGQARTRGLLPFEQIDFDPPSDGRYSVRIQRAVAAADGRNPQLRLLLYRSPRPAEPNSPRMTITVPGDTRDGFAVCALDSATRALQSYSSQGPTFDGRIKPDLCGFDRVSTASYGTRAFPGTSAASPHVAGAAAIVLSREPELTLEQLRERLMASAVNVGAAGADNETGVGWVNLPALTPPALDILTPTALRPADGGSPTARARFRAEVSVATGDGYFLGGLEVADFRVTAGTASVTVHHALQLRDRYVLSLSVAEELAVGTHDLGIELTEGDHTPALEPAAVAVRDSDSSVSIDVSLVIDRSGSMDGGPIDRAREAADLFVDLLRPGDRVSVVSYSTDTTTDWPLSGIGEDVPSEVIADIDFAGGMSGWTTDDSWAVVDIDGRRAMHESPAGSYGNGADYVVTRTAPIPLGDAEMVAVEVTHRYEIESGYDDGYLEVSLDGGPWEPALSVTGTNTSWHTTTGAFAAAGAHDARIRLRFTTDGSVVRDGWYVERIRLQTAGGRDAIHAAIAAIVSGGGTSIGGGLQGARDTLIGDVVAGRPRFIVLMSDGQENEAPMIADVLPSVIAAGLTVHTIGLGDADEAALVMIADATGGTYSYAPTLLELASIFAGVAGDVLDQQDLVNRRATVAAGEEERVEVLIDATMSDATLAINWIGEGGELTVDLEAPDGTVTGCDTATGDIRCASGRTFVAFRLIDPAPGVWTLIVSRPASGKDDEDLEFNIDAYGTSQLTFTPLLDATVLAEGQPNAVLAIIASEVGLGPVRMAVDVTTPSGLMSRWNLWDDGLHGDSEAGDGVYGAVYPGAHEEGRHGLEITCVGELADGSEFVRRATTNFDVETGADMDFDGLPDEWESWVFELGEDQSGADDYEFDGLTNLEELQLGTHPAFADSDRDGLTDFDEVASGTSPSAWDSDLGGEPDGQEVAAGTDPADPDDDFPVPSIRLSSSDIRFSADPGEIDSRWLTVSNTGSTTLEVFGVELEGDASAFTLSIDAPWTVAAQSSLDVLVSFTPPADGSPAEATLVLESNDPDNGVASVLLSSRSPGDACAEPCAACECGVVEGCACDCGGCEPGEVCDEVAHVCTPTEDVGSDPEPDAGADPTPDAGPSPADAGVPGTPPPFGTFSGSGCSCRVVGDGSSSAAGLALLLGLVLGRRRRRGRGGPTADTP